MIEQVVEVQRLALGGPAPLLRFALPGPFARLRRVVALRWFGRRFGFDGLEGILRLGGVHARL